MNIVCNIMDVVFKSVFCVFAILWIIEMFKDWRDMIVQKRLDRMKKKENENE